MNKRIFIFSILIILIAPSAISQTGLIWADEFDGSYVNTEKWNIINEADGTDSWYRPENVEVSGGTLKLNSKEEFYNNKHWTGARLDATFHPQYKYLEARVRISKSDAYVWATWWTIGWQNDASKWPPEFDICEFQGAPGKSPGQWYHYKTSSGQNTYVGKSSGLDETDWHTYGVYWTATGPVAFYIDGVLSYIADLGSGDPPAMAAKLKLTSSPNSAARYSGCPLAAMEIDYIRVYDNPPESDSKDAVIIFTKPQNNDIISGIIAVNAKVYDPDLGTKDGDGISNVVFELVKESSVLATKQENIAPYDWSFNTVQFPNGAYQLSATAKTATLTGYELLTESINVEIINTVSTSGSNDTYTNKLVQLFPNPARESLRVILDDNKWNSINIFKLNGEKVYSQSLDSLNEIIISLHEFSSGTYILQLNGSETTNYTFIVEK